MQVLGYGCLINAVVPRGVTDTRPLAIVVKTDDANREFETGDIKAEFYGFLLRYSLELLAACVLQYTSNCFRYG